MKIKLYFLGSGNIAVSVIDKIYKSDKFELLGICTQEDKPSGRKQKLLATPVGKWAEANNIIVEKTSSINNSEFIAKLKNNIPDIILVISFGQILKEEILNTPKIACVNIHASLLPKYRGASPIASVILNGDTETGVCFMKMEKGLDSGDVYKVLKFPLTQTQYADKLEIALGELAASRIEEILESIYRGELPPVKQNNSLASYAGKIKKDSGLINWNLPAIAIERKVRAYYPWPGTFFFLPTEKGIKKIIITAAAVLTGIKEQETGKILNADKNGLIISCGNESALEIIKLIPEGKKEMSAKDFLLGAGIK